MKIQNLKINDFRWFEGEYRFDFSGRDGIPSDIVLIYAPNGSGKTSVTEAVEWTFTGNVDRIATLLDEYNKKPREGNILKNRANTSVENGSVAITLFGETGKTLVRRATFPLKNGRKNDYGEGVCDPEHTDPSLINGERISDYILSQTKVNEFLFNASSGGLFRNYMSLTGRKNDLDFYYRLVDARARLGGEFAELKKRSKETEQEYSGLVKRRNILLRKAEAEVQVSYDTFALAFSTLVDSDFYCLADGDVSDSIGKGVISLKFLRAELIRFQAVLENVRADFGSRRLLRRRSKYSSTWVANRHLHDEATRQLRFQESKLDAVAKFCDLVGGPLVSNALVSDNSISFSIEVLDRRIRRVETINDSKFSAYEKIRDAHAAVERDVAQIDSWKIQIEEIRTRHDIAHLDVKTLDKRLQDTQSLIRENSDIAAIIRKRDTAKITKESWVAYGLENEIGSMETLSKELVRQDQVIKELDAIIVNSAALAERVSLLKLEALNVAREHNVDSCPACNHRFGSHAALIEAVLLTADLSNSGLIEQKKLLAQQRDDIVIKKETLERQILDDLDNVAALAEDLVAEQSERLLQLQTSATTLKAIVNTLSNSYLLSPTQQSLDSLLESTLREKQVLCAQLANQADLGLKQLTRVRSIASSFSQMLAKLETDHANTRAVLRDSGYFQLAQELRERWDVALENIESTRSTLDFSVANLKHKVAELDAAFDQINLAFIDVVAHGPELDDDTQLRLDGLEDNFMTCRSLLSALKAKVVGMTVFSSKRLVLRFDQALLSGASLALSLEDSSQLVEISQKISEVEFIATANKEKNASLTSQVAELGLALTYCSVYFQSLVKSATSVALLNDIYRLIDPHLSYHRIEFDLDMTRGQEGLFIKSGPASDRLGLDEKVEGNELVSPALFFSEAQSNVLSISLFLTKIAAARDKCFDFLIMDDPIQSMDDINAYAFIDMCRIFTAKFDKQIIITTHDIGFFNLFKKRFPSAAFNFKYFSIDSSNKLYE